MVVCAYAQSTPLTLGANASLPASQRNEPAATELPGDAAQIRLWRQEPSGKQDRSQRGPIELGFTNSVCRKMRNCIDDEGSSLASSKRRRRHKAAELSLKKLCEGNRRAVPKVRSYDLHADRQARGRAINGNGSRGKAACRSWVRPKEARVRMPYRQSRDAAPPHQILLALQSDTHLFPYSVKT